MKTVNVTISTLETLIEGLEDAIKVCYNVNSSDEDVEKSYPFATGYSRSAMQQTIKMLESLKTKR